MSRAGKKSISCLFAVLLLFGGCGQRKEEMQAPGSVVIDRVEAERDKETGWMSWAGAQALLSYPTDKSADEMLAMTKDGSLLADFVVMEDSDITHGEEIWDTFFEKTREGENVQIQIAHYYTLDREGVSEEYYEQEKDNYPVIYLSSLLHYEGRYYYLVRGYNTTEIEDRDYCEWNYLLDLYDEPSSATARFSSCVHYVLVNDNTLTWKEIVWGMLSSQMGDYISHRSVISKYEWKE